MRCDWFHRHTYRNMVTIRLCLHARNQYLHEKTSENCCLNSLTCIPSLHIRVLLQFQPVYTLRNGDFQQSPGCSVTTTPTRTLKETELSYSLSQSGHTYMKSMVGKHVGVFHACSYCLSSVPSERHSARLSMFSLDSLLKTQTQRHLTYHLPWCLATQGFFPAKMRRKSL